jgi:DNA polymerase III epsilon subunit-like protein
MVRRTVIYDLETSGFSPMPTFSEHHRVLQIAAICLETGKVFASFVNPGMADIPIPSSAIHNIHYSDVVNAQPLEQVMNELFMVLELWGQDIEFIAHNNNLFDELILKKELGENHKLLAGVKFWDTLPFIRQKYPGLLSYNLGRLYKHFYKTEFKSAHRADADVNALSKIYTDHVMPFRALETTTRVDEIRADCLTSIHMIGDYRAKLIFETSGHETVSQIKAYYGAAVQENPYCLDEYLENEIKMKNITQRMFVISNILELKPYGTEIKRYIRHKIHPNILDAVDYYVYYRYVLNQKPKRMHLYFKGMYQVYKNLN